MLLYKVNEETVSLDRSGDYTYMVNLVMEDYTNYFKASEYLQTRYDFCLQAIYSCLSKVNNLDNRLVGYKELSRFLEEIKKKTGLSMQIVSKDKLYVKEKPKVKIKRYRVNRGLHY